MDSSPRPLVIFATTVPYSELARVFCHWLYFHLRSKIFFLALLGGIAVLCSNFWGTRRPRPLVISAHAEIG